MNRPQQFPIARQSAGFAPSRRPGSIRRTTSIDSDWPEGPGQPWRLTGSGRDLFTPFDGGAVELATGSFRLLSSLRREIAELETWPRAKRIRDLVGVRAGSASRSALAETLGDLRGTPLFQLLDDFAGASLVAYWIWSRWTKDWSDRGSSMLGVCAGFAPGASSMLPSGAPDTLNASSACVGALEDPADPLGWHAMPVQEGPKMRRARRIDLWKEAGMIKVDAGFQDSGSVPGGGRIAVHEYRVHAEIDARTGILSALQAQPLILPFPECPAASIRATRMIGKRVAGFRSAVLDTLPATDGCTHLNDVLRSLADVPLLADQLP
jgi:hypothetical protein